MLQLSPQNSLSLQVRRMLRLKDEDEKAVAAFQELHSQAHNEHFGRLLRSPTAWEDLVKCILLCNCVWALTT